MDYVIVHQETGLLICKDCKFALIPSRIDTHFSGSPHRLTPTIRRQIKREVDQIEGLVIDSNDIQSKVQRFLESFNTSTFVPQLVIYSDRLACPYCSYISRSRNPIISHLIEYHDWENPRKSGQRKKKSEVDLWITYIPCQQFFKSEPGNKYFRVNSNRVSPIRIPTRPRIEISRESSSNSSSNDLNEDDPSILRPISRGKYSYFYLIRL